MQQHLDQILACVRRSAGDESETLDDYHVPAEAVLAIGPEWSLAPDNENDPNCGNCDSPEWDDEIDAYYVQHGPSTKEHKGHLYVLAGNWKYPIYFRFDRKE